MKKVFPLILAMILSAACAEASQRGRVEKGNQHYRKAQYDAAISEYDAALKKDPQSGLLHYNLGTAFYKKGDYRAAIDHLQKALLDDNKNLKEKTRL